MAEVKNNFLSAKMNQDIDDRILPNGQYRSAMNLQINRSEGSDVGSLQTVLGNTKIVDFNSITGSTGLESIGTLVDTANNRVFVWLTNYNDGNAIPVYSNTARNYIYVYNIGQNIAYKLVEGSFLNFSKTNQIFGANLIEDLLFWTDNRNQPRRINVKKALNSSSYYYNEDQISVAKVNPVYAMDLYRESDLTETTAYETSMLDVVSEFLPNGEDNPYYNPDYIGDPSYLEDKFVRFSYRYKFEDDEYSIFAPFTQIAYIPKQDGYFLYDNPDDLAEAPVDDETAAYRSTVVSFMYNKVNNIYLNIPLPCAAEELHDKYKISEIEILYKESDGLAVQVVDVISISEIENFGADEFYIYNYQAKKPFKTLPDREIVRVYDKTPVKALGQEVISNRIVYSNYQDKQYYPKYLNYNVACSDKAEFSTTLNRTSIIEYPNHTVKQNRNYQIGVVLSDRFGRQSGVILSNAFTSDDLDFGASSLYVPYREDVTDALVSAWPGYSLKVLFNEEINGSVPDGWPGIYNGDTTSADYNPLGWYSYKIVVKQTEQEYYNVYMPGLMASYPDSVTKELGKTSHVVLIGDNINKVPRDLADVSGTQEQYRSSVKLYSRVINNTETWGNNQDFQGNNFMFVNTIATNDSLFHPTTLTAGYEEFYQIDSNPLIGRLTTKTKTGVTSDQDVINLAISETEPFDSRLDIYWEATTTGLIQDINDAIATESGGPYSIYNWNFNLTEAAPLNFIVSNNFSFRDILGDTVDLTVSNISMSVKNVLNESRDTFFELIPGTLPNQFKIETTDYFYFGPDAVTKESYTFTFTVVYNSVTYVFSKTNCNLQNVNPTILDEPSDVVYLVEGTEEIWQFSGINGSNALGGQNQSDLTWSFSVPADFYSPGTPPRPDNFSIDSTGRLISTNEELYGSFKLIITLTDAGGAIDTFAIEFWFGTTTDYILTPPTPTNTTLEGTWSYSGLLEVGIGSSVVVRAGSFPYSITGSGVSSQVRIYNSTGTTLLDTLEKNAPNYASGGTSIDSYNAVTGQYVIEIDVVYTPSGGTGGVYIS